MPDTVFSFPVRVYVEDTDAGGIVYYVNYLKFMERARTEFMRSLGFEQKLSAESETQFVVHSANIKYLLPAQMDMLLKVSVKVLKVAKTYFVLEQEVYCENFTQLFSSAEVKVACIENSKFKPQAMPEFLYTALNQQLSQTK